MFAWTQDDKKQGSQPQAQSMVTENALRSFPIDPATPAVGAVEPPAKEARPPAPVEYPDRFGYKLDCRTKSCTPAERMRQYASLEAWDWDAIHLPVAAEALDPELGGIRAALADNHMSIIAFQFGNSSYNIKDPPMFGAQGMINGQYHDNSLQYGRLATQGYIGQKSTWASEPQVFLTYVIPSTNTQFVLSAIDSFTTYESGNGFSNVRMNELAINQMFLDNKLKVTVGYSISGSEVIGIFTGGNMATSLLGVPAILPVVAGQNVPGDLTPNLNFKYNFTRNFYIVAGVQRSGSPYRTYLANTDVNSSGIPHDSLGLRFHLPYAKAFDELEISYNRRSAPGVHRVYLRLDGFFNSTHFFDYRKGVVAMMTAETLRSNNSDNNWCSSDAIDYQVTQPDQSHPRRGWYEGVTFQYEPPHQNPFNFYVAERSYFIGPLKSRPNDMLSVNFSTLQYSRDMVRDTAAIANFLSHGFVPIASYDTTNFNVGSSYVAHIRHGMTMNIGVQYATHPTQTPKVPNALVGSVGLGLIM
jgi:hypothetical protein